MNPMNEINLNFLIFCHLIICRCFNALNIEASQNLMCRNEITGEELDWFALYKLPKESNQIIKNKSHLLGQKNPLLDFGTAYAYITNNSQQAFQLSNISINSTSSLPGQTLEKFYDATSNIGYVLYNDQADKVNLVKGHTKGVILFNEISAVWLLHSIPHFPPKRSIGKYFIQPSQCVYGQSMLCMSFKFDQLQFIGKQMLFNYPQIYDFNIPENLKNSPVLANLIQATQGNHVKTPPWSNIEQLTTIGGEKFISFAKFTSFADDLYSGLVAPYFKANLFTETWSNGAGTLNSNCSKDIKYHVINVEKVKFKDLNVMFSVHRDHSKWAITSFSTLNETNQEIDVACIGDINRQVEQFKRSGGTICFAQNKHVWNNYNSIVSSIEGCNFNASNKRLKKIRKFKTTEGLDDILILL